MGTDFTRRQFLRGSAATALGFVPGLLSIIAPAGTAADRLKADAPSERLIEELREFIPEAVKKAEVPGLSIAVIRDAGVLWTEGFGLRSAATGEPVRADKVFEAASLSKPAFGYAALKLCDEG